MSAVALQSIPARFRLALAGNPNCGKTTLFNALTGLRYKVANYPGVTVEKKEGRATIGALGEITVIDLPGIYSLSGHSLDEVIATKTLLGEMRGTEAPDLVVSVLDVTNLERNLYLTTQLIDLEVPVIVALNMMDVAKSKGITVRKEILRRQLGVPVVALSAKTGDGIDELKEAVIQLRSKGAERSEPYQWLPQKCPYRVACEKVVAAQNGTSRGALFRGSSLLSEATSATEAPLRAEIALARKELVEEGIDFYSFEATARYGWINNVVKSSCVFEAPRRKELADKIDALITHKIWGTLLFFVIMTAIFQSIFLWARIPMDLISSAVSQFGSWVGSLLPEGKLNSLLVNGVIAGVGSVITFVPQIAMLFFFLGLLEDSGYLSRAAFLMDKIMRRFGLQGRSFIPLLSSFACAIPGIMSTRTIPSFADRMTTILIAPLMSCSARLPVYTLLISAFVPQQYYFGFVSLQGMVLLGMYLLGIMGAVSVSWILKATAFRGEPALFVMEMPPFRLPSLKLVSRDVIERVTLFIKNAGTMILACSVVLWFLASYPQGPVRQTFAGRIGSAMEPALQPLGFNWEIGVGLLASFAAREVFVSSLSTVYNIEEGSNRVQSLVDVLKQKHAAGLFSTASAIALMVFYVFACQCMSTLAVCRRETGSWKWPAFMFTYMTALAYVASWITYQIGIRLA